MQSTPAIGRRYQAVSSIIPKLSPFWPIQSCLIQDEPEGGISFQHKLSLDQIEVFLKASEAVRFEGENRQQVYNFVEQVLRQQHDPQAGREARGLVRRYLEKMTGLSRAQVTRLVTRYRAQGEVQAARAGSRR